MMKMVLSVVLMVLSGLSVIAYNNSSSEVAQDYYFDNSPPSMKGVCWVAGDSVATHNMDQILEVGTNWISQTPFGWMEGHQSPEVILSNQRSSWGGTDRGIAHTTKLAKQKGIKTILKPHIWLRRGEDGKFRADIKMKSEEEWDKWFDSYRDWILHYARLAEENDIEALCIGTELHKTVLHTERWRGIINDIRAAYSGQITYAGNWYKEYEDIKFWDDLDFIGLQAYFPLSSENNPKKKDIKKSWTKHKKRLKELSKKYNKKIVFTEIGYKNTADAAIEPWTWPQDMDDSVILSEETQIACYQALFESLWGESWFDGVYIWKWFHSTYKYKNFEDYFEVRYARRLQRANSRGRDKPREVYFTPQRTGALEVLKKWYRKT